HSCGDSVLYRYGELWRPMLDCQNISVRNCDLSSVLADIKARYYARILINDICFGFKPEITPLEETTFGAPKVSFSVADSSVSVTITAPMGPQDRSIQDISRESFGALHVNYEVRLTSPTSKAGKEYRNASGVITLSNLEVNTEYCGEACYIWTHPSAEKRSEYTSFCVTVPAKPWMHMLIVPALIALLLLMLLALVPCQLYVTRKSRLPAVLNIPKRNSPQCLLDLKGEQVNVRICSESPRETDLSSPAAEAIKVPNKVDSYAPQDCDGPAWPCNSYTNQQVAPAENCDRNSGSTVSYSMVMTSRVPEALEDSASNSNEVPEPTSCIREGDLRNEQLSQGLDKKDHDLNSGVLMLPVSRVANGELTFSGLTFLSEPLSSLGLLAGSSENRLLMTPAGERTPLLTDVITMDETDLSDGELASDYGRTYVPNYVQQNFLELSPTDDVPSVLLPECTSSYRQNWEPGILPEPRFSDRIAEQLTGSEEEAKEPLSRLGAIFLDGLVVQIHG
ncbi:hypothetical protein NFI96_028517, partial [Prochilodus magdalenae]